VSARVATARIGTIVLLSLVAIVLHEAGHFLVYKAAGVPVRITLQSVRPVGPVDPTVDFFGKLAGPVASWILAAFLLWGVHRQGFGWATAAFTNASLRMFPLVMDLLRAAKGAVPFSDEGDVALAFTGSPAGRFAIVSLAMLVSLILSVLAANRYRFTRRAAIQAFGVYALSLACGIAVVIVDELIHR